MVETTTEILISTKMFSRLSFAYNCSVYVICIENKCLTIKMENGDSNYIPAYTLVIISIR